MTFKASSMQDCRELASIVSVQIGLPHQAEIASKILGWGLMREIGLFGFAVRILRWIRPRDYVRRLELFYHSNPAEASHLLLMTAQHIVAGKDTVDRDSVGGFSQAEIDQLVSIIRAAAPEVLA
ncbi:MAG: hypothetical protein U9R73_00805 [Pseudomonadota bacterium]|nr:hypothetical protein [Pseudomonadota bacterium]